MVLGLWLKSVLWFQYFVFDFHMPPVMLFDKIITLSVSSSYKYLLHIFSKAKNVRRNMQIPFVLSLS